MLADLAGSGLVDVAIGLGTALLRSLELAPGIRVPVQPAQGKEHWPGTRHSPALSAGNDFMMTFVGTFGGSARRHMPLPRSDETAQKLEQDKVNDDAHLRYLGLLESTSSLRFCDRISR